MRKNIKTLFIIIIVVGIGLLTLLLLMNKNKDKREIIPNSYTDNEPYKYPITPGSDEWKQLKNHDEMIDNCQIPETKLKMLTTNALVETVLEYPLRLDF